MDPGVLVPPYRRIAAGIAERISRGQLRPGDRVPSARQITREHGVAIATATKVLAALRADGLTTSRPGVGTVVLAPAQRPGRELNRAAVVRAAIRVADTDGLAELSMRRVAGELGVATMSLYRHVASKDELVTAMIDEAVGELALPPPGRRGWRADLELCARAEWAAFVAHPWLAPSMSLTRPQPAPNAVRLSEWVMAAFDGTGLPLVDRMYVQVLLFGFVRGVAGALEPEAEALRETGLTGDQWMDQQSPRFAALFEAGALPRFQELVATDFDFDLDLLFAFGLARLLDGIEAYVRSRAG